VEQGVSVKSVPPGKQTAFVAGALNILAWRRRVLACGEDWVASRNRKAWQHAGTCFNIRIRKPRPLGRGGCQKNRNCGRV